MEKTLEERVIDLESLFMDFPEIMNLRFNVWIRNIVRSRGVLE